LKGCDLQTPSDIVFALREGPESPQRVEITAMQAPGFDLDKLARVGDLPNELEAGTLSLADTFARRLSEHELIFSHN
jgi:hypothetical protein